MFIMDADGQVSYYYFNQTTYGYTFTLLPNPFAYAGVFSSSPFNGDSSIFTFTLTLSIDTPIGAYFLIYPPDDILFDYDKPFYCKALLNLNVSISCSLEDYYSYGL